MFRGYVPYACAFILSTFFYVSVKISTVNEGKWQGLALGSVYDIRMEISGRRRERTQEKHVPQIIQQGTSLKALFFIYVLYHVCAHVHGMAFLWRPEDDGRLRTHTAQAEDNSLGPHIHTGWVTASDNSSFRRSDVLF